MTLEVSSQAKLCLEADVKRLDDISRPLHVERYFGSL